MKAHIFLTIFFLALYSTNLNGFHLEGHLDGNRTTETTVPKSIQNGTVISRNKTHHELLGTGPIKQVSTENSTEGVLSNKDKTKSYGPWWSSSRYTVPEKPLNLGINLNRSKRVSFGHSILHKSSKDSHKLGSSLKDNNLSGIDVVVVDFIPSYARTKPRINTYVSPPFHYAQYPTSSIFDLFMGLSNSMNPSEMASDIYSRQNLERTWADPFWDRRLPFGSLMSPPVVQHRTNFYKLVEE
ncbi:hypothetical protein Bhyg_04041, partial [Pseudolycoriella hygida]